MGLIKFKKNFLFFNLLCSRLIKVDILFVNKLVLNYHIKY